MKISFLFSIIFLIFTNCSVQTTQQSPARKPKAAEAVPVTTARAVQKTVPVKIHAIGNGQAYSTVSVKAQVGGTLQKVNFKEGEYVKKGDLVFTLDSRPFEAQLKQAEANLAKDRAQAENARKEVNRYQELVKNGYVASEQYERILANSQALEGTLLGDEAAIENAKLQLEYCFIRSPIDGITGNLLVHEGNVVKANDLVLLVINQVRPIYVSFSVPGRYLPEIRKYRALGKLKVEAAVPGKEGSSVLGDLTFVDNAVDLQTGMIQLKGLFSNQNKTLWPGQFVNVDLFVTKQDNAIVVPSRAVQTGQTGQFLYVINPGFTVEFRSVVVESVMDEEAVIEKGVSPGDQVVTDGQLRLVPGSKVVVRDSGSPAHSQENQK
ncbi:MAG: efflux RND transporter periplasmic adaptor subunit [Nitrospirae bacterium]|nr:efflux RND transporter periplasmic adaptor subunit [Nitrospirota bacterium]MBI3351304.1 efflux RND transporter periplasmic adaptor subunit [Nitrospirota bacterium]